MTIQELIDEMQSLIDAGVPGDRQLRIVVIRDESINLRSEFGKAPRISNSAAQPNNMKITEKNKA